MIRLLCCLFCLAAALPAQETLDRVLVVVDEEIILESQVQQELQRYFFDRKLDPAEVSEEELEGLKLELVQSMIDSRVMLAVARADTNIVVDERTIDRQVEQRLDGIIRRMGTVKRLEEAMGQPLKGIRTLLRRDVEQSLYIEQLQGRRMANVEVTRQQVEQFFAEHQDSLPRIGESLRLSHIFLEYRVSDESDRKARARADSVYTLLQNGADFADLAILYSQDSTAPDGGLIGRTKRGSLVRPYEEAAYRLEAGEISPPVRSRFGWHVIRLNNRSGDYINTSHILYRLEATEVDRQIVREEADSLHARLEAGEDFAELARQYSDHAMTRQSGGDLGWVELEQLVPLVRSRVRTLEPGEYTWPLEGTVDDKEGMQLYRVEERRPARDASLEEDWEQISRLALSWQKQQMMQEWLEQIREEVFVQIID